jgi:putative ABC transport system substrate-binding protein
MLALSLRVTPLAAEAQPLANIPRIGLLRPTTPSLAEPNNEAFRHGLRELGYVEGKNILIEYRFAEGKDDRLPDLAAELVRLNVDVIVTAGIAAHAAKQVTSTIPIVAVNYDLDAAGLAPSLARPSGNSTGLAGMSADLAGKRLELLQEAVPNVSRVAVLWNPDAILAENVRQTEVAGRQLGVNVQPVEVRDPHEIPRAYAAMTQQQANAVIIIQSPFTNTHISQIVALAIKHRLPSMYTTQRWTNAGCLLSYGPDQLHIFRRAATYVDKILRGAKPAELPVERPMQFESVINLKTAQALGLTMSPTLLFQATEVIQ